MSRFHRGPDRIGIDAKKTHVIIISKLLQIEQRLEKLERLQRKLAGKDK